MGPHCRKTHGFAAADVEVDFVGVVAVLASSLPADLFVATVKGVSSAREAANKLVHRAAVEQSGETFGHCIAGIAALGFTRLADRLVKRAKGVYVEESNGKFLVTSPYNEVVRAKARKIGGGWQKSPTGKGGAWAFPVAAKGALWGLLREAFPAGTPVSGSKGVRIL